MRLLFAIFFVSIVFSCFSLSPQDIIKKNSDDDLLQSQIMLTEEEKQQLKKNITTIEEYQFKIRHTMSVGKDLVFTSEVFYKKNKHLSKKQIIDLQMMCNKYDLPAYSSNKVCSKKKLFITQLKLLSYRIYILKLGLEVVSKNVNNSIKIFKDNKMDKMVLSLEKDLEKYKTIIDTKIRKSNNLLKGGIEFLQ